MAGFRSRARRSLRLFSDSRRNPRNVRGRRCSGKALVYVLDTNTVIYFLKGVGRVKDQLLAVPPADVALPSIVVFELEIGITNSSQPSKRRMQLDTLLSVITVLPFDLQCAKLAAESQHALRRTGNLIGPMDALIAATALVHRATLVTHNVGEFRRVRGLHVEDWL